MVWSRTKDRRMDPGYKWTLKVYIMAILAVTLHINLPLLADGKQMSSSKGVNSAKPEWMKEDMFTFWQNNNIQKLAQIVSDVRGRKLFRFETAAPGQKIYLPSWLAPTYSLDWFYGSGMFKHIEMDVMEKIIPILFAYEQPNNLGTNQIALDKKELAKLPSWLEKDWADLWIRNYKPAFAEMLQNIVERKSLIIHHRSSFPSITYPLWLSPSHLDDWIYEKIGFNQIETDILGKVALALKEDELNKTMTIKYKNGVPNFLSIFGKKYWKKCDKEALRKMYNDTTHRIRALSGKSNEDAEVKPIFKPVWLSLSFVDAWRYPKYQKTMNEIAAALINKENKASSNSTNEKPRRLTPTWLSQHAKLTWANRQNFQLLSKIYLDLDKLVKRLTNNDKKPGSIEISDWLSPAKWGLWENNYNNLEELRKMLDTVIIEIFNFLAKQRSELLHGKPT